MINIIIICALLKKEIKEITRDRIIILMVVVMPILNLVIMGYSVNLDAKNVATIIIDKDSSLFSRDLIHSMRNSGYFDINLTHDEILARRAFSKGLAKIIIHIPDDFSKNIISNKDSEIFVETDATEPSSTANALQTLQYLVDNTQSHELNRISSMVSQSPGKTSLVLRKWFNPRGDSHLNIIPGLIGMILSIMPMLMVSLSIIREREKGTLRHIQSSGISPFLYLLGKSIPYVMIGLLQLILMLGVSIVLLDVPIKGSSIELFGVSFLFIVLSITIGIGLTTLISNQLQAMQLLSFYFLFSNMLSGFLSPFEAMPQWSQWLGNLIPLTHFIRLIRGIMIKNNSVTLMGNDVLHLVIVLLATLITSHYLITRSWTKNE